MAGWSVTIKQPKVVLVEGKDEVGFFAPFLTFHGINSVQAIDIGGKNKLPAALPAFLNAPGIDSVTAFALVRDADDDEAAAVSSLKATLGANGQPIPAGNAQFAVGANKKTGIFVVPGGGRTGALEDLVLDTVRPEAFFQCVTGYFDCLAPHHNMNGAKHTHVGPKALGKAMCQAVLAARPEPLRMLGVAAQAGYVDFGHGAFDPLRQFLAAL